jgi:hypothetical protein
LLIVDLKIIASSAWIVKECPGWEIFNLESCEKVGQIMEGRITLITTEEISRI